MENETLELLSKEEQELQLELEALEEEVNGMDEREKAIGEKVRGKSDAEFEKFKN